MAERLLVLVIALSLLFRYACVARKGKNNKGAMEHGNQKSYTVDFLTKKKKKNNGELTQYYITDNHPAIIPREDFLNVQLELTRRNSKKKVSQKKTKSALGKYCSKYALSERLVCGECGSMYRRTTWVKKGKKKVVWRCISRLEFGTKYCHHSPTIEESVLQEAIMNAILKTAQENAELLKTLKLQISMGLEAEETEDKSLDIQIRIAEIDTEFKKMLNAVSEGNIENFDEEHANELMSEKQKLTQQLEQCVNAKHKRESAKSRLDEIFTILDGLKNHPITYDDQIIRQILECVIVKSKEEIEVVFAGGLKVREQMTV